jgi:hypothetical protein
MRGIIGGKPDVTLEAAMATRAPVPRAFEINSRGSNTLQSRDFEDAECVRARLIEATVEAIAHGSSPRLRQSRLWL